MHKVRNFPQSLGMENLARGYSFPDGRCGTLSLSFDWSCNLRSPVSIFVGPVALDSQGFQALLGRPA
jgi:hypothetical protein